MIRSNMLSIYVVAGLVLTAGCSWAQGIRDGYVVPPYTLSPNKLLGVTVPQTSRQEELRGAKNEVVDAATGKVIAIIRAETGWDTMNVDGPSPTRWAKDGSVLLWHIDGKETPIALVLLKVEGPPLWQVDVLKTAQLAILAQTKKASPQRFLAASQYNRGRGAPFREGVVIDVTAGDKAPAPIALPFTVRAKLTSKLKGMDDFPKEAELQSELEGVVDVNGQFSVTKFEVTNPPPGAAGTAPAPAAK